MEGALREGGESFHRLTAERGEVTGRERLRHGVEEETRERLAGEFRGEWMRRYHEVYGPSERDLDAWLARERDSGDAFGGTVRSEWEALGEEVARPFDAAGRGRAEADAVAAGEQARRENQEWRRRMAANFQSFLGKGAVLEELAGAAEARVGEIRSA
ncbi:hypothetical protein, partial [Streptomyces ziwulingensis]